MLLTKPLVATILVGVGLAHTTDVSTTVEIEPDSAPQTTYAEELTTVSTLLPLPTVVIEPTKVNDTAPIFNGTYHALGVDAAPQATQTFVPLIWEQVVTSDPFAGPPPLPDGTNGVVANVTFTNSTAAPGLSLNFTQEAEVVKKRFWSLTKRALPTVVDWRSKWGINWLASIQDQGPCGSCWAFSATALLETMARIQHGAWSKRSEGDLHDSYGVSCGTGGWPANAISWAGGEGRGIADPVCLPYLPIDNTWVPCPQRSGRTLKLPPAYTFPGNSDITEQKRWIADVGPLTGVFEVYSDFDYWTPNKGVYKYDGVSGYRGLHAILIVGYDDNQQAWIIRNSWGRGAGDNGYYLIGYGQVKIDAYSKTGITNVDPDPWTRRRHHNGNMVQTSTGETHRNLEVVRKGGDKGLLHVYRNGGKVGSATNDYSWHSTGRLIAYESDGTVAAGINVIGQPAVTSTSYNRDLELVYWVKGGNLEHWYYSQNVAQWYYTGRYGTGDFAGYPGFIQLFDSSFAIVVRNKDGSLYEWNRKTDTEALTFISDIAHNIKMSGPALVQSNIGESTTTGGTVFVAAVRRDGRIQIFSRPGGTNAAWSAGEIFAHGIGSTPPVMIQSFWSTTSESSAGSLQLVVAVGGSVQHWQRRVGDLEAGGAMAQGTSGPWRHVATFGSGIAHVWSLVHGSFGHALELVAETKGGRLVHWQYTNAGWRPTAVIPKN